MPTVKEFARTPSQYMHNAAESHEPLSVSFNGKPFVSVVSDKRLAQLMECEEIVSGLLRLSKRGASSEDFAAYADLLREFARIGKIDTPGFDTSTDGEVTTAA